MLIKKDPDTIQAYFEDSSNLKGGNADAVYVPENLQELSAVLKEACGRKAPVTISGGGTTTTGSRVPFGGTVISMERLKKVIGISREKMSALVEAGVTVEDLKLASEKEGLFYMCHPTEKTAFVGGTVATNASGARSFKYGPTRRYVKRLKMVLSNGSILEVRRGERFLTKNDPVIRLDDGTAITVPLPSYKMPADVKNAAGYYAKDGMDLIDLFIGQEGTLSVIGEVELGLVKKPARILSCFVFFAKEEDAWLFADDMRSACRRKIAQDGLILDILSIEYFGTEAVGILRKNNVNVPQNAAAAIFIEQEVEEGREGDVVERWAKFITRHNASVDDTWVAMNEKEVDEFSGFRYLIPEAVNEMVRKSGFAKISNDIAVPDSRFLEMMRFYREALEKSDIQHVVFGHMGESHVHVNLLPKSERELAAARDMALAFVKKGVSLGGTVSAEHGIGKIKHRYLEEMYGREGILEMVRIKKALDPACILGLDNIFQKELLSRGNF
ncbi:MAG: FAD-binding oxidoreductase [Candidatus Omnitrophica bacterium]|nr:FAD-binding oxidoreductase [Candidatus Omnitrophota bacterium]